MIIEAVRITIDHIKVRHLLHPISITHWHVLILGVKALKTGELSLEPAIICNQMLQGLGFVLGN